MCRRQLSTHRLLRARTILWTHVLSPFIASDRSLLPLSDATLKLKEKRVNVDFVSIGLFFNFIFILFYFTSASFLQEWRPSSTRICTWRWDQRRTSHYLTSGRRQCALQGRVPPPLHLLPSLPLFLLMRRRGRLLLQPRLKSSLLPSLKGCACLTRRRRRLILACPPFRMTRVWRWTGLMGLWLPRIWRSFLVCQQCYDSPHP